MKSIPTKYEHIQFRSRLEARWAAFFNRCGWEWEYEPLDLEGWIPDFMLMGKSKVLVEVKPYDGGSEEPWSDVVSQIKNSVRNAALRDLGGAGDILLLGTSLSFISDRFRTCCHLGQLCELNEYEEDPDGWKEISGWGEAVLGIDPKGRIDFCHDWGHFCCRMHGEYNGSHPDDNNDYIRSLWRSSCNDVQWRRPR